MQLTRISRFKRFKRKLWKNMPRIEFSMENSCTLKAEELV
jgi:hypothetical protein